MSWLLGGGLASTIVVAFAAFAVASYFARCSASTRSASASAARAIARKPASCTAASASRFFVSDS
jgi:hypothetical protein